ncbi:DDE-type integrase/transposase/recombinase [Candidatus Neptunichlamydia sp. REUL1]|uniref:DDE-type integrase/transposase/recombinase n=1 Tax=Candidatus Neptunichlamydia sp. REUL1 TaxID=3064277 RepID=UPI0029302DA8|nr:DDE-type integrase/transposase/recombinase [Candidatus Neptunochlamydia sp. REUL1]
MKNRLKCMLKPIEIQAGKTIDFYLSDKRDMVAALTFFCQISSFGNPKVINVDKYACYPPAFNEMKGNKGFTKKMKLRQVKYLNNILEQDHRSIKRQHSSAMGYKSLKTARNTITGIEAMHIIFKGQIDEISDANAQDVKIFIEDLFEVRGLAA